jgi:hypothetical protein
VRQSAGEASDHGDAGAADPGEQGERLEEPDDGGFTVMEGGQATCWRRIDVDGRVRCAGGGLRGRHGFGVVGIFG